MRIIPAPLHRILDYITILTFVAAPLLFGLVGTPALLSYALAAVHLVLTQLTRFFSNGSGVIPFRVHGTIEIIVGIALLILPFAAGWTDHARPFYATCGVVFAIVWMLTDYAEHQKPA